MRRAKAVFVSSYLSIASGYALWALWILASRRDAGFLGILLATLPILHLTVGNLVWNHSATTSRWLPLPSGLLVAGNLVGLLPLLPGAGTPSLWVGLAILDLGYLAYLFWYSRFPSRQGSRVQRGAPLPPFQALRHDGTRVSSLELAGSPALLIFYRG
ncbi:MAG: hypothetical protein H6686_11090, partial [Fibrobacteria bacterium]|nr:hypothetical protein [Fibrobacteria bacterium]